MTGEQSKTSKISREHHIDVSASGLVTVAGGKWTTYRRMAEDALSFAAGKGLLERRNCVTRQTPLHGARAMETTGDPYRAEYGSDAGLLDALVAGEPELGTTLDPALPYTLAEVVFAVRCEMARTLEDVLSRRTRALLLDERGDPSRGTHGGRTDAAGTGRGRRLECRRAEDFCGARHGQVPCFGSLTMSADSGTTACKAAPTKV